MSALDSLMAGLAQHGRGSSTLQDLEQQRRGVVTPTAEGYKQAAYGIPAGVAGLPGDLEGLARLFTGGENVLPTSEDVGRFMGANTDDMGFMAGTFLSPDPASKIMAGLGLLAIPARKLMAGEFAPAKTKAAVNSFTAAQNKAREKMTPQDRAQVDPFSPDSFSGTAYITPKGEAGFTLTPEGYLGHVFKDPDASVEDVMTAALTKARAEGGKNLDAFDTYLADSYKKRGAVETGRSPWSPEYATEEIIEGLGEKQPDFVSMNIGGVFPEYKHSQILGPREQTALERYTTTPKGKPVKRPATIDDMFTPEKREAIKAAVQRGVEAGGHKWYETGGIQDKFIEVLGTEEGTKAFREFMNYASALSPRSTVAQELKRASVLYNKAKEGPIETLDPSMFPKGYGHLATTTAHKPAIERLAQTGSIADSAAQPKIASYDANRAGNYRPMTIDTHIMKQLTGTTRSPSKGEYPFIEEELTKMADEMGLDPAEFQAAMWVGGATDTGVANAQNITSALNQRIAKTAEHHGIPEEEAMTRFINRDLILRALLGAIGTGALGKGMMQTDDQRMQ